MKLETLKDLSIQRAPMSKYNITIVKQLVIKHIKALRNGDCEVEGIHDTISVILYLKHIFNITEENLKSQ